MTLMNELVSLPGRIVRKLCRKVVVHVLGLWHRRHSQYTSMGRVALCCIAKMENEYIRHYVEYYKDLEFDNIFIYDNNDPEGERFEEVIGDYIDNGFVKVIDYRGRKIAQLSAYQDCYDRHNKEYDWIAFFDCDEFLTFADKSVDIHTFLSQKKFLPYQVMHVNWMVYGDNGQLDNDGRDVTERLITPIPFYTKGRYGTHMENEHVKSILRGGLSAIHYTTTHTPHSLYYKCCSPEGDMIVLNTPFKQINYSTLYLRHYSTKTIGEWVKNKMRRGIPDRSEDRWKSILNLDLFFHYNERTTEKEAYAKKIMGEKK